MEAVEQGVRIATFNAHWGGSNSAFPTIALAIKNLFAKIPVFGQPDEGFEESVFKLLDEHHIVCLQEFPFIWDDNSQAWQPDVSQRVKELNFQWHCVPQMNPSLHVIPNVPKRLLTNDQYYGNAIAVSPRLKMEKLPDITVSPLDGDFTTNRRYPSVKVSSIDNSIGFEVVGVQTKAPHIFLDEAAKKNIAIRFIRMFLSPVNTQRDIHEVLLRSASGHDRPVVIAGDFNWPRRAVKKLVETVLKSQETDIADLGTTWPRIRISKKLKDRFVPGIQLDHIVGINGIEVLQERTLAHLSTTSDHAPASAVMSSPARSFDFKPA